jgi:protein transport protein SEC31
MGVAGPPPGQPQKLSTAPTASAMPVTDGMPTPWPLPTKTQQIRATNQAVAGANQAVQDNSVGSGIAKLGDPLPPHEVQHIKAVFENLLNTSPDQNPRKREDIAKKLEELYSKLAEGQMKTQTSQKVVQMMQACEQGDFPSANRIQMELCTTEWETNRGWLMGVKRLLTR